MKDRDIMKFFDISFPIDSQLAIYPNNPKFSLESISGDPPVISEIRIGTHTGTHIDMPSHALKNGETLDMVELKRMNGRAKVFDVTRLKTSLITKTIVEHLDIEEQDIVIFKTMNTDFFQGKQLLQNYVTLDYLAADYLVSKNIKMVGIDYLSIELPRRIREENRKSVHKILLEKGILILEGLNLKIVKEGVYRLICLPLNIIGADGCPVRAVLEKEYENR